MPKPEPQKPQDAEPPQAALPPVAPAEPEPQKPQASAPSVPGVTPELAAYVRKTYGPAYTILAVGKTQMIVWSGDPKRAGTKVQLPQA